MKCSALCVYIICIIVLFCSSRALNNCSCQYNQDRRIEQLTKDQIQDGNVYLFNLVDLKVQRKLSDKMEKFIVSNFDQCINEMRRNYLASSSVEVRDDGCSFSIEQIEKDVHVLECSLGKYGAKDQATIELDEKLFTGSAFIQCIISVDESIDRQIRFLTDAMENFPETFENDFDRNPTIEQVLRDVEILENCRGKYSSGIQAINELNGKLFTGSDFLYDTLVDHVINLRISDLRYKISSARSLFERDIDDLFLFKKFFSETEQDVVEKLAEQIRIRYNKS